jgi:hypothetical protein
MSFIKNSICSKLLFKKLWEGGLQVANQGAIKGYSDNNIPNQYHGISSVVVIQLTLAVKQVSKINYSLRFRDIRY